MAKSISSRVVAFVVVAMMIIVALGVYSTGALNSTSPTTASTTFGSSSVSTVNSTVNSTSSNSTVRRSSSNGLNQTRETSNSTLGLELLLSVNSTEIPSEDAINISTWVLNTRPTANNLTAANDWPIHGLTSGLCGQEWYPAGMAVFRGNYVLGNLSDGRPLSLWPLTGCVVELPLVINVTSFSFLPKDDIANYSGYFSNALPNATKGESYTRIDLSGTVFAANGTGFYSSLDSALPSNYTLVAGDEWGQITMLHFEVTPSDILPKVGNFLSYASGCSPGPCIGQSLSGALVFNCAAEAATPSGCTAIYNEGVRYSAAPPVNYTVTVWYPSYNQPNEPASANCMYTVWPVGALGKPTTPPGFGYCFMVSSTAFVVTVP